MLRIARADISSLLIDLVAQARKFFLLQQEFLTRVQPRLLVNVLSAPVLHILSQIADIHGGRCALISLGGKPGLAFKRDVNSEVVMETMWKTMLGVAGILFATQAAAQITFYEGEGFRGRTFMADRTIDNFDGYGFNDRAKSAIVDGGRWQVCEHARFEGQCVILQPGSYDSLGGMGMNNRISSVRPLDSNARYDYQTPTPLAAPTYEYRQRPNEQLYEVPVSSVRAVVGPPEQRCWMERQQVVEDRGGANVPGAIIGGILGGVLGHQIGSGRGRDVATAGGAVAGAAVGANVNRGGQAVYDRDVQRCETVSSGARPEYWDVTYSFRGIEHRAQFGAPPGPTITVNENGEPRG